MIFVLFLFYFVYLIFALFCSCFPLCNFSTCNGNVTGLKNFSAISEVTYIKDLLTFLKIITPDMYVVIKLQTFLGYISIKVHAC